MIRITVEMVPFGLEAKKRVILKAEIANVSGIGTSKADYRYQLSRKGNPESIWKRGKIKDFQRKRRNAWDLIYVVLKDVVGSRN